MLMRNDLIDEVGSRACEACEFCEGRPSLFLWHFFTSGEEPVSFPANRPAECPGCGRPITYGGLAMGFPAGESADDQQEFLHGPRRLIRVVFGRDVPRSFLHRGARDVFGDSAQKHQLDREVIIRWQPS